MIEWAGKVSFTLSLKVAADVLSPRQMPAYRYRWGSQASHRCPNWHNCTEDSAEEVVSRLRFTFVPFADMRQVYRIQGSRVFARL